MNSSSSQTHSMWLIHDSLCNLRSSLRSGPTFAALVHSFLLVALFKANLRTQTNFRCSLLSTRKVKRRPKTRMRSQATLKPARTLFTRRNENRAESQVIHWVVKGPRGGSNPYTVTGLAQSVERLIAEGRRFDFRDPTNTERSSSTQRFIAVLLVRFLPPG